MTNLHTQARDEAARLRAAGDAAADLVDALRKENERLREALESINLIHDGAWSLRLADQGLKDAANIARAALTPHGAVTPEAKGET